MARAPLNKGSACPVCGSSCFHVSLSLGLVTAASFLFLSLEFKTSFHTSACATTNLLHTPRLLRNAIKTPIINTNNPPPKMDPYSSEGELINIHAAFHQYQYDSVLSDFDPSSFSAENHLPARILQLRARIALGQAKDVLDEIKGEKQPELVAVSALATLSLGDEDKAVGIVETLLSQEGDAAAENAIVQVLGGGVLAAAGKGEEALALLGRHQGNREYSQYNTCLGRRGSLLRGYWLIVCGTAVDAVALIVQIHLQQNRNDLAVKEVTAARRWAQDSILVNLAESWVGLRLVRSIYTRHHTADQWIRLRTDNGRY